MANNRMQRTALGAAADERCPFGLEDGLRRPMEPFPRTVRLTDFVLGRDRVSKHSLAVGGGLIRSTGPGGIDDKI